MKAEHRKELETNALADRVGRAVQGMKQMPRKRTFVWVLGIVLVAVVAYWFYAQSQRKYQDNAFDWYLLADGRGDALQKVLSDGSDSNQSKVVNYELGFLVLYDTMRRLASDPKEAVAMLDERERYYRQLVKQSPDDKVLLPEALFAIAVIEETRILTDQDHSEQWQKALAAYKEVADKHADSAFGKEARKRVAILSDEKQRDELLKVYQDLRIAFVREEPRIEPPDFFRDLKKTPTPPKSNTIP
jgi:hypothetical protein